ncbi:filamentous hemagglutinin N-terminal domain-containing protein [Moorena producens]|uniref:filamentous hemagglutinin N-terminal domain-containing protein n=1 Tax=Moorena producens TaxID=1155739 RepID=UPI003C784ADD
MALDVLKRYNTQFGLALCLAISGAYAFSVNQANAQITPDATLPQGERSQLDLGSGEVNGKIVDLIKGGAIRDINLFHSFLEFNVGDGQSVYFANPAGIQNILSRVTGANPSNILGTLGVDGGANLFLINPKGIFFGDKAKLDVSGSFVGTTADGIGFGNRGVFSASNPEPPSPLLTVNPNVFFFNQIPGKITSQAKLEKLAVDNLLLLGGDIEVSKKDNKKDSKISTNQGGNILLAGLGAPGEVALTQDGDKLGLDFPDGVKKGNVVIKDSAIETSVAKDSDVDGGDIRIIADSLEVETSNKERGIFTITKGNGKKGGDIIITADSSVKVTTNNDGGNNKDGGKKPNQGIFTKTEESGGAGGKISITADLISVSTSKQIKGKDGEKPSEVEEDQGIFTKTAAVGSDGGEIILTADRLEVSVFSNQKNHEEDTEDQGILTKTTAQAGNGGKITINAGSVLVTSNRLRAKTRKQTEEGIFTKTEKKAGIGGDIEINVTGDVLVTNKGTIKTKTTSSGQGGTIEINAPNGNVTMKDRSRIQAWTTAENSKDATGHGGETIIKAGGVVAITEDSKIENRVVDAEGNSGKIEIIAAELWMDSQRDMQSRLDSNNKKTTGQPQITSKTNDNGNAGSIEIRVGSLTMIGPDRAGSSGITSNTDKKNGKAGDITIIVEGNFIMKDRAKIEAKSQKDVTGGDGGTITIQAGSLSLSNKSNITAEAKKRSKGNPGNINITVDDKIEIIGKSSAIKTQIDEDAGNNQTLEGGAANITIKARSLSLKNGGRLEASTKGKIPAGDITINATDFVEISGVKRTTQIVTQTKKGAEGPGGRIEITTPSLRLSNRALLDAKSESDFDGGEIKINADDVQLTDGAKITATSQKKGNPGNIDITAKDKIEITNSDIQTFVDFNAGNPERAENTPGGVGNIRIEARSLSLKDGGELEAFTLGKIPAGNITVNARDFVEISGVKSTSGIFTESRLGAQSVGDNKPDGGMIEINTGGKLTVSNDAAISARSIGKFEGGEITINAKEVEVTQGGEIISTATNSGLIEVVGVTEEGEIETKPLNGNNNDDAANAGKIRINASEQIIVSGSEIKSSKSTVARIKDRLKRQKKDLDREDDKIINKMNQIKKENNKLLKDKIKEKDIKKIKDKIENLEQDIENIKQKKREIKLETSNDILVIQNDDIPQSRISVAASRGSNAGGLTITSKNLTVEDGARASVSAVPLDQDGFPKSNVDKSKRGEAGKLTIEAESLTLDNGKLIAATGKNTTNNEATGTIEIKVPGVIILDNNSLILASATGDAKGGNIDISGGVLVALPLTNDDKGSDIFANAQDGDGGDIKITLQGLFNLNVIEDRSAFIDPSGNIDRSLVFGNNISEIAALSLTGEGQSGTVTRDITNSAQDPEILPTSLVDPSALILANCPRSGKVAVDELGEFIVTGRGGLPPSPLDPITQRSVLVDWVTIDTEEDQEETIKEAKSTPTPDVSYLPMRGKRRTASTPTPARPKKKIVEAQGWTVGEDGTIILTAEPNNGTPKSNWYSPRSCGSKG